MSQAALGTIKTDVAIIGGGIAGLWLLNLLRNQQVDALLFEQANLGGEQTMASQGMIHGGLKYTLGSADSRGGLSSAAQAIAAMPERWRDCFAGAGDIDLSAVKLSNPDYFMFASGTLGRLSSFFASKALRGKIERVAPLDFPPPLKTKRFNGHVYRLNDPVVDVDSLLRVLSQPHLQRLVQTRASRLLFDDDKRIRCVETESGLLVKARQFLFCAGAGNQAFADQLRAAGHAQAPATQLRPLHQVFVQHEQLTPLYAHCLTGVPSPEPRLTITSHGRGPEFGWYIGGALATRGIERTTQQQIEFCRTELNTLLPWINWQKARYRCLRVDRAEPAQSDGNKPDEACVIACANALLCWPTKLALTPNLGRSVLALLAQTDPDHLIATPTSTSASASAEAVLVNSSAQLEPPTGLSAPPIAPAPWL